MLEAHVAPRNRVEKGCQHRFWIMAPAGDKKRMDAIDNTPSVKVMRSHGGIQGPHGSLQHAHVLLPLSVPFPSVNATPQGFFQHELNLSSRAVGHEELDVFSIVEQRAFSEELKHKNRFSEVATCNMGQITKHSRGGGLPLSGADGFQTLFDYQPGEVGHANVLGSAAQCFDDPGGGLGRENKSRTPAAFLHHATKVRLARTPEIIGVFDDDDPGYGGTLTDDERF